MLTGCQRGKKVEMCCTEIFVTFFKLEFCYSTGIFICKICKVVLTDYLMREREVLAGSQRSTNMERAQENLTYDAWLLLVTLDSIDNAI